MGSNLHLMSSLKYISIAAFLITTTGCEKNEACEKPTHTGQNSTTQSANRQAINPHIITEEEAAEYVQRFQSYYPDIDPNCYFTKHAMLQVLSQPNVNSLRYYYGEDVYNGQEMFLIAADGSDNDILTDIIKASPRMMIMANLLPDDPNPSPTPSPGPSWNDLQKTTITCAAASNARHRTSFPDAELAGLFDKETFRLLLSQPGVVGVSVEYGLTEDLEWNVVLRGLDRAGNVIPGFIIERSKRCPPFCGNSNVLNS